MRGDKTSKRGDVLSKRGDVLSMKGGELLNQPTAAQTQNIKLLPAMNVFTSFRYARQSKSIKQEMIVIPLF